MHLTTLDEYLPPSANNPDRIIPVRARIERDLPLERLFPLSLNEGSRKRPVYEIHKWWARRLGVNFRMILLSALHS